MRFALVAQEATETNRRLVETRCRGVQWACLTPSEALAELGAGDVALGRLDVLPTLDGVDDGLWSLGRLAASGVRVLNRPSALLAAHDKLLTARLLHRAGLPHPATRLVVAGAPPPAIERPVVVKPRFGSWGRDVARCEDTAELALHLLDLAASSWFKAHGALVQELVEPRGFDVRVLVAGGRVVGAISRVAAPGEWRTNVALGAVRERVVPPANASALAVAAAAAAGADLVGIDLLPDGVGGWSIVELNGAVDFTTDYSLDRDVFAAASFELARVALGCTALERRRLVPAPPEEEQGAVVTLAD